MRAVTGNKEYNNDGLIEQHSKQCGVICMRLIHLNFWCSKKENRQTARGVGRGFPGVSENPPDLSLQKEGNTLLSLAAVSNIAQKI